MSIDLSQFKQTFLEESDEGLDVLESGLLALDSGTADDEVIHAVFRAAHSIKGGAGTFSLTEIASFTHVMETLLDEMRDGRRAISKEAINVLLNSVDVLRELLDAARDDVSPEMGRVNEVQAKLEAVLNAGNDQATEAQQDAESEQKEPESDGWVIKFHPHEHMLRTGNDTVRMFKELAALGDLENQVDLSGLPEFEHMDPELSYLSWTVHLKNNEQQGPIDKAVIEEIFEWVEDDCDLTIEPLISQADDTSTSERLDSPQAAETQTAADNVTPITV